MTDRSQSTGDTATFSASAKAFTDSPAMPLTGPQVHQQLLTAQAGQQNRLQQARQQIQNADQRREQLEQQRDHTMVELAEYFLPELTPDAVRTTWQEIRPTINEILHRKEQAVDDLRQQLDQIALQHGHAEQTLTEWNAQHDLIEEEIESLAATIESRLAADPKFAQLSEQAARAEAALERAEDNLNEADQDAVRKLPAYEESDLFTYLKDRDFGTGQYKPRGMTRRIDRWLAKLIGYQQAKRNYDFLKSTPESMRQIIAEDRAALDTVMAELERMRDDLARELGADALKVRREQITAERNQATDTLNKLDQQSEQIQRDLNALADRHCDYYQKAIAAFRGMIERSDTRALQQRARQTVSLTDDQIIARMNGLESEIGQLDATVAGWRNQISTHQQIFEAIGRLIQRFRSAGFASGRCLFADSLDVLGSLARADDTYDVEAVWDQIRRTQSWGPSTMDRITEVATHPMTQVLLNAMASAAGAALQEHARRAGHRRNRHYPRRPW
ncbi:coiled-coil domain-containing protein [Crateriforma conspicua]|uniref:hypothetical protein n=1 Tax=Crateriforma conspicua TaxID=2527996 RepID=UPI0018C8885E|nr:hypothetical protein [Crateriforma conspicua]